MVLEIFSARVREARTAAGLTQTELDALLDLKPGAVAKWEAGNRLARHESLDKLSEIFNLPVSHFFDGNGMTASTRPDGRPRKSGASFGASSTPAVPPLEANRDNHGQDELTRRRRKSLKARPPIQPGFTHVGGWAPGIMCHFGQAAGF